MAWDPSPFLHPAPLLTYLTSPDLSQLTVRSAASAGFSLEVQVSRQAAVDVCLPKQGFAFQWLMGLCKQTFTRGSVLRKSGRIWAKTLSREDFPFCCSSVSTLSIPAANPSPELGLAEQKETRHRRGIESARPVQIPDGRAGRGHRRSRLVLRVSDAVAALIREASGLEN